MLALPIIQFLIGGLVASMIDRAPAQKMKQGGVVYKIDPDPIIVEDSYSALMEDLSKEVMTDKEKQSEYFKHYSEIKITYKPLATDFDPVTESPDAFRIFRQLFDEELNYLQEQFIVLFVDRANKPIGWFAPFKGSQVGVVADPKIITAAAISALASGVVVAHNHPSNNLKPSDADIRMAKLLKDSLSSAGIVLLDSLVIAGDMNNYTSMADKGYL